jgi:ribose/xylose/arabinose/galactoside ABC-type transport system permease subunit
VSAQTAPRRRGQAVLGRLGSLLGLVLLCAALAAFNEQFRSFTNYLLLLQQTAPIAIIAVGQTFVILTGGIDLSVGSLAAFTTVCTALMLSGGSSHAHPVAAWVALPAGVAIAVSIGFVQGLLVTKLKMPPFIITLGSFNALAGLALVLSNGSAISVDGKGWDWIYGGDIGPLIPIGIMLAIYAVASFVLGYTRLGRYTYAIGGNEAAVRLSGVAVDRYKVAVYAVSGLLTGCAAMMILAQNLGGSQSNGQSAELNSIAAVVIGGTSLAGGVGSVWGTLIGAIVLVGVVPNALVMLSVSPQWNQVVTGGTVVLAVLIDVLRKRARR